MILPLPRSSVAPALAASLVWVLLMAKAGHAAAQGFDFYVIGDAPYCANDGGPGEAGDVRCSYGDANDGARFDRMRARINEARPAFTVHIGDIKTGAAPCTDVLYLGMKKRFNGFDQPLVYTPGDNEWTDCKQPGAADNLTHARNRLAFLRETFFTPRSTALGGGGPGAARLKVEFQSEAFPENLRWELGGIVFATLHAAGSDNNAHDAQEAPVRWKAVADWIRATFAAARDARAVVFFAQADPRFEQPSSCRGFVELFDALVDGTLAFGAPEKDANPRQVLFVHGDSHLFRVDKPLYVTVRGEPKFRSKRGGSEFAKLHLVENFTRVESFGSPEIHALRVRVDPQDPQIFSFQPVMIPGNYHRAIEPGRAQAATPFHSSRCD